MSSNVFESARYSSLQRNDALSKLPNFFWCPNPQCKSGQIHESSILEPIVVCTGCRGRFCFQHRVPWHETMGCEEFDRYLQNPHGFRSQFELINERAERERDAEKRARQQQEDRDWAYAQNMVEDEQRAEARRIAEKEQAARIEREKIERQKKEAERRVADEERRKKADEVARRKREEDANLSTISRTTKNCPGCRWPIEKRSGW